LYNGKTKNKTADGLSTKIAQKVVDELDAEVGKESSWMNTFKIN
jgi:RNA 3'-terminal phosphate cyclase (ATP)